MNVVFSPGSDLAKLRVTILRVRVRARVLRVRSEPIVIVVACVWTMCL